MRRYHVQATASGGRFTRPLGAILLVAAFCGWAAPVAAQVPKNVRVVTRTTIVRWFPIVPSDVLTTVDPGTVLEAVDREGGWYWIVAPVDENGTRKGGWIDARDVEPFVVPARPATRSTSALGVGIDTSARTSPPPSRPTPAPAAVAPAAAPAAAAAVSSSPTPAASGTPRREYVFEDIHFALNRAAIRPVETKVLDDAVNLLKNDPSLRLNLEGHTCNVGSATYNLVLGDRRAKAVKDYLVNKGVAQDRLRTVSFGEARPKHDNSRRATRQLNRRVALVPDVQP